MGAIFYCASNPGIVTGIAAINDFFTLTGATGAVVTLTQAVCGTVNSNGNNLPITLVKRSSADTGGTTVGGTSVFPLDSGNVAALSTVNAYSASPTSGTTVGTLWQDRIFNQLLSTVGIYRNLVVQSIRNDQGLAILNGPSEVLAFNAGGNSNVGGFTFYAAFYFIEVTP